MPGPSQKMLPAKLLAKHYSKRPGRGGVGREGHLHRKIWQHKINFPQFFPERPSAIAGQQGVPEGGGRVGRVHPSQTIQREIFSKGPLRPQAARECSRGVGRGPPVLMWPPPKIRPGAKQKCGGCATVGGEPCAVFISEQPLASCRVAMVLQISVCNAQGGPKSGQNVL